jgi:hypothetical protein
MANDPASLEGLHRTAVLVWHSTAFLPAESVVVCDQLRCDAFSPDAWNECLKHMETHQELQLDALGTARIGLFWSYCSVKTCALHQIQPLTLAKERPALRAPPFA